MELTAKTIREVTFGAKVRGYDPAEVDEFIAAVAEGIDELQERLRRSIDRATRAEQASVGVAPVVVEAVAASGTSEISKVWERAVTAAEEAIAEAKATAQQLLDSASSEAETRVDDARSEVKRISDEAQVQLRAEIVQLEGAREQLQTDVARLADYLDEERAKVRSVLTRALAALDDDSTVAAPLPEVAQVDVPETSIDAVVAADWSSSSSEAADDSSMTDDVDDTDAVDDNARAEADEESAPNSSGSSWAGAALQEAPPALEQSDYGETSWVTPSEQSQAPGADDDAATPQTIDADDDSASRVEPPSAPVVEDDADQDPFLAELRKAVQDDMPLGPRDEVNKEHNPLEGLYSQEDDDDKKGFFPWKK